MIVEPVVKMLGTGLDMILPLRCLQCNAFFHRTGTESQPLPEDDLAAAFDHLMDVFLCPACRRTFIGIQSPLCTGCGLPFESPHSRDHLCETCRNNGFRFQRARSAGRYEGALRTLVHQFKYHGCVHLADGLGRLLWRVFLSHWDPDQVDAVIPVPLHPKRWRHRGFNQARQLVRSWPALAVKHQVAMGEEKIKLSWLVRTRCTRLQTGLDRRQRQANVKNAFALKHGSTVAGRKVLLVDDVLTTGATVQACARVLKQGGAEQVDVLTVARTV